MILLPLIESYSQKAEVSGKVTFTFAPLLFTQDPGGNFYLIDKSTLEIVATDQNGIERKRTSGNGFGTSELVDPAEIIWKGMLLYVLDRGSKSIKLFDRLLNFRGEHKLSAVFPSFRIGDPVSMTVNDFGEIFITDRLIHTILAADQHFKERGDVFFIENLPGKKLQFPVKIVSEGDFIAVRDSAGIFLFDRFLNYVNFTEQKKSLSFSGMVNDRLILTDGGWILICKPGESSIKPKIFQTEEKNENLIHYSLIYNNRLLYIAGNEIRTIQIDQLLNEQ